MTNITEPTAPRQVVSHLARLIIDLQDAPTNKSLPRPTPCTVAHLCASGALHHRLAKRQWMLGRATVGQATVDKATVGGMRPWAAAIQPRRPSDRGLVATVGRGGSGLSVHGPSDCGPTASVGRASVSRASVCLRASVGRASVWAEQVWVASVRPWAERPLVIAGRPWPDGATVAEATVGHGHNLFRPSV